MVKHFKHAWLSDPPSRLQPSPSPYWHPFFQVTVSMFIRCNRVWSNFARFCPQEVRRIHYAVPNDENTSSFAYCKMSVVSYITQNMVTPQPHLTRHFRMYDERLTMTPTEKASAVGIRERDGGHPRRESWRSTRRQRVAGRKDECTRQLSRPMRQSQRQQPCETRMHSNGRG